MVTRWRPADEGGARPPRAGGARHDLRDHALRPQHTDGALAVSSRLPVQRPERVVERVTRLHRRGREQEPQERRAAEESPDRTPVLGRRELGSFVGQPVAEQGDRQQESEHQSENEPRSAPFEQLATADGRDDEGE